MRNFQPVLPFLGRFALAITVFLGPVGLASAAEQKHPEKALLWKIEGGALEKPSYLFGTIHLGDPRVTKLHPAARKAFGESEAVYTEIPMDMESQMAIIPMIMRKDGKTLDEAVGEELAARFVEELKLINPALDSTPFQTMATWMPAMTLPVLSDQLAGRKALDQVLWEEAASAGKSIAGIETAESQVEVFAGQSEEDQKAMFSETMRVIKKEREKGLTTTEKLVAAYLSGDPVEVNAVLAAGMEEAEKGPHGELSRKFMKRLLDDRDVTMAATIAEILKKEPGKSHFFAIGSGHLVTDTSIRSHLEKAGYNSARIGE